MSDEALIARVNGRLELLLRYFGEHFVPASGEDRTWALFDILQDRISETLEDMKEARDAV